MFSEARVTSDVFTKYMRPAPLPMTAIKVATVRKSRKEDFMGGMLFGFFGYGEMKSRGFQYGREGTVCAVLDGGDLDALF